MSDIERELVKASRMRKVADDYKNRQEYMADIVRHFDKVCARDDSVVDSVSEDAYTWYEEAATAINTKDRIPEFPDIEVVEAGAEPDEEVEEEPENVEEEGGAEPDIEDDIDDENEPEDDAEDEPEPEVKPKKAKKVVKAKPKKVKPRKNIKREGEELNEEGRRDKYGVVIGTIRHEVLKLFEKGATQAECKREFGATYYNLLKQMSLMGHLVERTGPGVFRLTAKEDTKK
jgi:hypothetical protein